MGRVLFVATVATHIRAFHLPFIKMLQEQGHQVEVACCLDVPLESPLPGVEMPVWEIPFARSPYSLKNVPAYYRIKKLLAERSYDLVHVNTPAAAFITRLACRNATAQDAASRGINGKTTARYTGTQEETAHNSEPVNMDIAARRGVKTPVLYMAHGFHFYWGAPPLYQLLYYNMERLASRWTAGLIVLNREDLLAARGFGLIEGESLFLVHGVGVDLDEYSL